MYGNIRQVIVCRKCIEIKRQRNTLYIKEFSYPLGATVVLLMEEDTKGSRVGNLFMEAVVSLSAALLERECAHYVVWKKKMRMEL